jgi:hypothetical protein
VIIRPGPGELTLITQPDHARLAGQIMAAWTEARLPVGSRRDMVLLATASHDNGWEEIDVAPLVDDQNGALLDFVHAPDDVKRGIWPRAVQRLAQTPYAAALVAQHALHLHDGQRGNSGWREFLTEIESTRDRHLSAVPGVGLGDLLHDYAYVRLGDLLSLAICNGWLDTWQEAGFSFSWNGAVLAVSPDPFGGREIRFSVPGRLLARQIFASSEAARSAFLDAPRTTTSGIARGQ